MTKTQLTVYRPLLSKRIANQMIVGLDHFEMSKELFLFYYYYIKPDVCACESYMLRAASHFGLTGIVKEILEDQNVDLSSRSGVVYKACVVHLHLNTLKVLLEDHRCDISHLDCYVLSTIVKKGRTDIVKLMLRLGYDPRAHYSYALISAALYNRVDIMRIFLADPRMDPSCRRNLAYREAKYKGSQDVMRMLEADPRVDITDEGPPPPLPCQ